MIVHSRKSGFTQTPQFYDLIGKRGFSARQLSDSKGAVVNSSRQHPSATWPFVCMLAVLFALSVTAPRAWQDEQEHFGVALAIRPDASFRVNVKQQPSLPVLQVVTAHGQPTLAPPPDLETTEEVAPAPSAREARIDEPAGMIAAEVFPPLTPRTAARPGPIPAAPEVNLPKLNVDVLEHDVAHLGPGAIVWPEPVSLLKRLAPLTCECQCCTWALNVDRLIRQFTDGRQLDTAGRLAVLDELEQVNAEADSLAAHIGPSPLATELRQAQHAVARRMGVWRPLVTLETAEPTPDSPQPLREFALAVADVENLLSEDHAEAGRWRDYILLDTVRTLAERRRVADRAHERELARKVVARLNRRDLTPRQRAWIDSGPLANLEVQMQHLAAQPVDPQNLLVSMETFERTALPADARAVAAAVRQLSWSADPQQQALGRWIDQNYRNANFRFSLRGELLSRLLPEVRPTQERVDDTILGVPVDGYAVTSTDLFIRPVPAQGRLRLELVANGTISSQTRSDSGLAILHNRGQANYSARKRMDLCLRGATAGPATVDVQSESRLRRVDTDLDMLPVVGYLFQEAVRSEYSQNLGRARREQERKIEARVTAEVDRMGGERFQAANQRYQQRVLAPLEKLSVTTRMIEARSTEDRIIARVRLAGDSQLGSHTPRPVAPSDSLMSMQMHQSALNNLLEGLELEGGTFSMAELNGRVSERLNRPLETPADPAHEDVVIRFAPQNAVRARFVDDRIELTVAIAELTASSRRWQDFAVRVFYRPSSTSLRAELVRDGSIQLIGPDVRGAQIALRGIFSRAFTSQNTWPLFPGSLRENRRLEQLEITQCVLDDGWFGLAVGPHHDEAARRTDAVKNRRR